MQLGWMMPCFDVADLARSMVFYEELGFRRVGGSPDQGWAIMANGPLELGLYSGHFQGWMLNFRGGNVPELTARYKQLGLNVTQVGRYTAEQWPDHSGTFDGEPLPFDESGDCTVLDLDGRVLYFDTYPIERIRFKRGDPYATDGYDGSYAEGQPRLGQWCIELLTPNTIELEKFYDKLGVKASDPQRNWKIDFMSAAKPDAAYVAAGGTTAPQDLRDPDGYRILIRP
jgi:hypothetical protein